MTFPTLPTYYYLDHFTEMLHSVAAAYETIVAEEQDGNRRVIASVDDTAHALRLRKGMTVAHAQSLVPDLALFEATPDEDEAALTRLALWCTRYSPLVTPDPPGGIFIDVAGSSHLFKGEAALLKDAATHLSTVPYAAKLAIADTPGCAWAMARFRRRAMSRPAAWPMR